ncbi:MAG TPA: LysR family transcriptional regulator [Chloroflexota bacterium]|nr:LysR family transcriptional regulator [Chloroflexota bacterium]
MEPKLNVWLEMEGEVVLSLWRVELLTAVAQTGSISAAAAHMGVPYRIAWQKIHEMESRLGQKLVETQTGGKHGGGATLTQLAQEYIDRFNRLSQELDALLQERFPAIFPD